jgi:hypothetical protein
VGLVTRMRVLRLACGILVGKSEEKRLFEVLRRILGLILKQMLKEYVGRYWIGCASLGLATGSILTTR